MTKTGQAEFSLWKFLASIRLTVVILLLLAAISIFGTLIPQGGDPIDYIRQYGENAYRLLHVFNLTNMYSSWWFRGLIAFLVVNIVVCTWKRFPGVWKILISGKAGPPSVRPGRNNTREFNDFQSPEALRSVYESFIRKHFRHHWLVMNTNGFRIVAEKGKWTSIGVTVIHLSVVILLAGALIGSIFGFDGYVNIAEGESIDRIRLRNSATVIPLGFEVRCEDFDVSFYDSGAPREYRSSLRILENGQTVVQKDIIVNDPLRYKGINFFQSSYGSLPPRELILSFTRRDSGEVVRQKMAVGRQVGLTGTDLRFYIREIRNDFRLRGMDVGETVLGVLDSPGREPEEVILPMRFPSYDKMRKGEWVVAVDAHEHAYYTGLQVTRDPGVPLVYAGFILLIVGCYIAFFMAHQKIVVEVVQSAPGSEVKIYGTSSRNPLGFEHRLRRISAELGEK